MISEKLKKALRDHKMQALLVGGFNATESRRGRGVQALNRYRVALIGAIEAEVKSERDAATVAAIKQCMKDIRERM